MILNYKVDYNYKIKDNKKYPENCICCVVTNHLNGQGSPKNKKYFSSLLCYIRMTELVNLQEYQQSDYIHEGCVKLKVLCGGADVVAGTQQALHDEGKAKGIVYAILVRNTTVIRVVGFIPVYAKVPVLGTSSMDQDNEKEARHQVAKVAEHVTKIFKDPEPCHAFKVEIANILVTRVMVDLLMVKDKLKHR